MGIKFVNIVNQRSMRHITLEGDEVTEDYCDWFRIEDVHYMAVERRTISRGVSFDE